ncbi:MAG: polyketide cyclase, partial [Bacteroidota bacterium]
MKSLFIVFGIVTFLSTLQSCRQSGSSANSSNSNTDSLKNIVQELVASNDSIASRLKKFDTLDYEVFSNQQWRRFKESHAQNVKVYWPDGHVTEGLDIHLEDMKKLFI